MAVLQHCLIPCAFTRPPVEEIWNKKGPENLQLSGSGQCRKEEIKSNLRQLSVSEKNTVKFYMSEELRFTCIYVCIHPSNLGRERTAQFSCSNPKMLALSTLAHFPVLIGEEWGYWNMADKEQYLRDQRWVGDWEFVVQFPTLPQNYIALASIISVHLVSPFMQWGW